MHIIATVHFTAPFHLEDASSHQPENQVRFSHHPTTLSTHPEYKHPSKSPCCHPGGSS